MQIELLYFDGCPSWQDGLRKLREALTAEGFPDVVQLINVGDDSEADRLHFLGSPSFRVNGQELWPESRAQYALGCRVYQTAEGLRGTPSVVALREKLRSGLRPEPV